MSAVRRVEHESRSLRQSISDTERLLEQRRAAAAGRYAAITRQVRNRVVSAEGLALGILAGFMLARIRSPFRRSLLGLRAVAIAGIQLLAARRRRVAVEPAEHAPDAEPGPAR